MRRYSSFYAASAVVTAVTVLGCCLLRQPVAVSAAGAPQAKSSFNAGPARAAEDPAQVAKGKTLYSVTCQACHGKDLRGGDMGGPNLLRSQVAMGDQHGEQIIPIIQGARAAQGMPNMGLNNEDAGAVAAYVRSVIGQIGSQGRPPGESEKEPDILVGNADKGKAYFAANCASCHSVTGDLQGYASKFKQDKRLQADWVAGGLSKAEQRPTTVEITLPAAAGKAAQTVSGNLVRMDDFLVTVKLSDGTERTFARHGAVPHVVVHDPLQWHRDMLPRYKDSDIHDLTSYLVTLK